MRAVIQRVLSARVTVDGKVTGEIARGLVVLLGVEAGDAERDLAFMADKIAALRIFEDDAGKMNRSVREVEGAVLLVSQFTLLGDCRKGMRPSFDRAERPERARQVYEEMIAALRARGVPVETGVFQAMMQVELVNDGPVTVVVDSRG